MRRVAALESAPSSLAEKWPAYLWGNAFSVIVRSKTGSLTDGFNGAKSGKRDYRVRREKAVVHSGGIPARELVRSTR